MSTTHPPCASLDAPRPLITLPRRVVFNFHDQLELLCKVGKAFSDGATSLTKVAKACNCSRRYVTELPKKLTRVLNLAFSTNETEIDLYQEASDEGYPKSGLTLVGLRAVQLAQDYFQALDEENTEFEKAFATDLRLKSITPDI